MSSPAKITFRFDVPFAVAAAIDELSLRENVTRNDMILAVVREGLEVLLMNHPDLNDRYEEAKKPRHKEIKRRGNIYRFQP